MRKITFLMILLTVSCLAFAIDVADSAELAAALVSAPDGATINLAAGTYYPPQVTMTFADYWADETGGTTIEKTFNAFVIPEKDITISGASTSTVIFDRNSGGNDWQMAFVFFSDGDDTDGTGITFENFTVQNLDYGLVNSWALTKNYFVTPASSYMEYTLVDHVDFNDVVESAIILEPKFYNSDGSKGSNNTDLFSRVNFDWNSLVTGEGDHDFSVGFYETEIEIVHCNFTDIDHKAMVNGVGINAEVHDCVFENGWRGFHVYHNASGAVEDKFIFTNNTFLNFDADLYPGIPYNNIPQYGLDSPLSYNSAYFDGRGIGLYNSSASKPYADFIGNYYEAKNGAIGIYTDNVKESSNSETYNYIGSAGWIKDLHNVEHVVLENCNFHIYDEGLGIVVTKHGDGSTGTTTENEENYDYVDGYGHIDDPIQILNCNFFGYDIVHNEIPGTGSGIFLAEWEHYTRDNPDGGVSYTNRNRETFMHIENCRFENLYAVMYLDAGRPDDLTYSGTTHNHDDGRLQIYLGESKFINCTHSIDFTVWDQWVRTNSFVIMEKNYFGGFSDPYDSFVFADDFPVMDAYYDLNLSPAYSGYSIGDTRTYSTGIASSPITHSVHGGDDYRVYYPQFLQYLPYYKDEDMTELSGLEVANLSLDGSDNLSWGAVADPDAKYAVYYSAGGTSSWTQIGSYNTDTSIDVSSYTADYFKVAVVIPNHSEGAFYGTGMVPTITFGEYPEVDFDFNAGVSTFNTVDFEYGSESDYAVSQIGVIEKTLDIVGTKYYLISLPFNGNYNTATALYSYLGLDQNTDTVSHWDVETQGWETVSYSATLGWDEPFSAEVNDVYMLNVELAESESIDILLQGTIPESPVYNMITTNTTNLNFIMLPINSDYATADDLGAAMGTSNTIMISQWNETYQSWESCVYISELGWINDFALTPGQPIVVGAVQDFTWPQ